MSEEQNTGQSPTPCLKEVLDQILSLNKQLPAAKADHEKTALQRQIDSYARGEIDAEEFVLKKKDIES